MKVLDASCDGSDVEAWNIQEWATELGLLEPVEVTEPCSETSCMCAECENIPGTCYRPVKFLAEAPTGEG